MRRSVCRQAAAVIATIVVACTPLPQDRAQGPSTGEDAVVNASVSASPAAPATPAEADRAEVIQKKNIDTPPPPRVNDDPGRLMGLDDGALTALLGTPGFVRRDAPAELWRYRDETCVLDLFLYSGRKLDDGRLIVRHVEARGLAKRRSTPRDCLRTLLLERLRRHAG